MNVLHSKAAKRSTDEQTATLLDYQFRPLLAFIITLYSVLVVCVGVEHHFSSTPVCNSPIKLEAWVDDAVATAAGCAVLTCLLRVIRIASLMCAKSKMKNTPLVRVNIIMLVLNGISASSAMMTLFWNFGGICEDSFGVLSPGLQWSEWFVTVPLLNYIACAVEQKTQMGTFDTMMISLLALMIVAGFLMTATRPHELSAFFLAASFTFLVTVTIMSAANYRSVFSQAPVRMRRSNYFSSKQTHRKATLLVQLLTIMWYYPTVWVLAATGAIPHSYAFAAFSIGGIFGKVIFSTLVIESHVSLLYEFLITTSKRNPSADEEDHLVDATGTSVTPILHRAGKNSIRNSAAAEITETDSAPLCAGALLQMAHHTYVSTILEEVGGVDSSKCDP